MVEFRIIEKDILMSIWLNGNKGNVVVAPGMPQYFDKYHPLVEQLARLGYNLFIPRYPGTWESNGVFNIKNSTKSIEQAIRLVKKGQAKELYANKKITWARNPVFLLGFSYGALPAILQSVKVNRTILICPFIDPAQHINNKKGENIQKTFEFLQRAYPQVYRIDAKRTVADLKKVKLPQTKTNLFLVVAKEDPAILKEEIDAIIGKYSPQIVTKSGGHSIKMDDKTITDLLGGKNSL
ncbi:MAG: alpha/beta hydrolase [Candidatus ainarchaeum sp.]|nr:alpha/beta hydrolase [Candidatus ainarchaeum sp.]